MTSKLRLAHAAHRTTNCQQLQRKVRMTPDSWTIHPSINWMVPGNTSAWGGTLIYFLYRDIPTVRVSFSGSSVLTGYTISHFRAPPLECVKTQTYVPFVVFWIRPAWFILEQGKKLQHFLLDRVSKFTPFVSWTGSGFCRVGRTPLPTHTTLPSWNSIGFGCATYEHPVLNGKKLLSMIF